MAAENMPPDFVNRMEKVPAPYQGEQQYGYSKDGLSCAMIAWMLDIDVRAATKKRELQRTYQRMCLYIKHMERLMDQANIKYDAYSGAEDGRRIKVARETFKPQLKARFMTTAPYPITAPISTDGELCRSVSDAQTFEYKLHQLEVLRYMERADEPALTDFEGTTRKPRPETG
ncbi:hypothetical protein DTO027I6_9275 [Penicillium roqueforti]|uniref:uncharacterized protein n=1 Tax=Penicillium roqueforti TaxID=5082 RepID=UPI00190BB6A9|nr:uncharacterized protein LCP9604111_1231 [Penicillium roqueforti]KAF9253705.1 hypothetical protein LCP9604111_1231 [Penicillium roqueforti]KAI1829916.1 hypothetical protein CBS147337_9295 [Penicillium roqueforti]KAI2686277.1 hypothetical protein CBS147355_1764 [Penicillium roqueforti]KAI2687419.1 hypothetical protein LCP963914a_4020 [Penicillium roqueforti]KAI2706283.1 hypothetical protein CBS147372_194 [Penicillium roqueforti]